MIFFSCHQKEKQQAEDLKYASLNDSTAYVGKEACRQCHADKYETFIHTGMGSSFDTASHHKSAARFTPQDVIFDNHRNLNYYPHWENDSLILTEFRLSKGDTIFRRNEKISWIVGSGQHTNSHLINVNGYIYQAPATFYTQRQQWDLPPGFEGGYNSRFSRQIGLECITCHNAYPEFVKGSENKYEFISNGIDCERCHGPGKTHISEKLAGKIVDTKTSIDYSIVNPAKLPSDIQMDVCQRCHIQGNAVLREGKSFLDFRPGMHLSDVMNVFMPVYKGDEESHIMASHAERLKMSRCFVSTHTPDNNNYSKGFSQNTLTCITCHNPHISVRNTDVNVFNSACKSCHYNSSVDKTNFKETPAVCREDISVRNKVNNNCVSCHMPKNGTIDIPHVTTTDHWIHIPVPQKELKKTKEFATLLCINNPNVDLKEKGSAFISYFEKFSPNPAFLDSAKKYFDDSDSGSIRVNFKSLIRINFLKNNYKEVIRLAEITGNNKSLFNSMSYSNEDAWAAYRIGESYYQSGKNNEADIYFSKSVRLAPYELDFRNKLASVESDLGNYRDAKDNYRFIIHENPEYASAYVSYGFLMLQSENNVEFADSMYDKALRLDPDNIQALINKSALLIYHSQNKTAEKFIQRILSIDKSNEQALLLISRMKKSNP